MAEPQKEAHLSHSAHKGIVRLAAELVAWSNLVSNNLHSIFPPFSFPSLSVTLLKGTYLLKETHPVFFESATNCTAMYISPKSTRVCSPLL